MKNKLQIVWSSIAIISVCACGTPYTQPDAPIEEDSLTQVHLDDNFLDTAHRNSRAPFPSHPLSKNVKRTAGSMVLPLRVV